MSCCETEFPCLTKDQPWQQVTELTGQLVLSPLVWQGVEYGQSCLRGDCGIADGGCQALELLRAKVELLQTAWLNIPASVLLHCTLGMTTLP